MGEYNKKFDISIVVVSRNDNHGGDPLNRLQLFLNTLVAHIEGRKKNIELVIVEWNPPTVTKRLSEVLNLERIGRNLEIRFIEVTNALHSTLKYSESMPLFQMIGKNVGIKRARGDFVLATNIDIIFSHELAEFLFTEELCPNSIYRVDRIDVSPDVPINGTLNEQIEFCESNILAINHRSGSLFLDDMSFFPVFKRPDHQIETAAPGFKPLHTNGSGDFQLASKRIWETLRGYPELEMYSLHIDSVFEHMAYEAGYGERYLGPPLHTYHLNHSDGYTPHSAKDGSFNRSLSNRNIARLSDDELRSLQMQMSDKNRAVIFNGENWGFGSSKLSEKIISSVSI